MTRDSYWVVYMGFGGDLTAFAGGARPVPVLHFDYFTTLGPGLYSPPLSALPHQKFDDESEDEASKPFPWMDSGSTSRGILGLGGR
jgi:hypothetical protein